LQEFDPFSFSNKLKIPALFQFIDQPLNLLPLLKSPLMISYKRVASDDELRQILEIQKRNMRTSLTETEIHSEGFITIGHDFEILKKMNTACPHIISSDEGKVIAYALTMTKQFKNEIPALIPMFETADALLGNRNYMVMGQICIAKPYRRQGHFKKMYNFYREQLHNEYDCLFTEVATDNIRSLEAHKKVGFKVLKTEVSDGISWELVNWDWT